MIEKSDYFVDMPKLHDKAIIRLDIDEVALLLDYVENCGKELTGQKSLYEKQNYAIWLFDIIAWNGDSCFRMCRS